MNLGCDLSSQAANPGGRCAELRSPGVLKQEGNMSRRKFWMVMGSGAPTVKHYRLVDAEHEAERLARAHPGQHFTILVSMKTATRVDVAWEPNEDDSEAIPPF